MAGDREEIPDLSRQRKQKRKVPNPKLKDSPPRPRLVDVPAIIVRLKDRNDPVALINLPPSPTGADLVLCLIDAYPDASVLTTEITYVRLRDIVRVECPERGVLQVADRQAAASAPSGVFRPIKARLAVQRSVHREPSATLSTYTHPHARKDGTAPAGSKAGQGTSVEYVDDFASLANIPDTPLGHALLAKIIKDYGAAELHTYTLCTTDFGYITVHELAKDDLPPR